MHADIMHKFVDRAQTEVVGATGEGYSGFPRRADTISGEI